MKPNPTRSLFLMLLLAASYCLQAQTTYYVSAATGNDANTGTSTATAFQTVQKAIAAAKASSDASVEIRVESGVYKPTDGTADAANRDATFNFTRQYQADAGKSLKVYGGYNFATGTRDFIQNPSYLDGDIGTAGDVSDNSYHVIAITNTSSATDSLVIDGFTIRNGTANGSGSYLITGNASMGRYQGGGINLLGNETNTKLAIRHCTFTNNTALQGGAISVFNSSPYIKNCVFYANSATGYSGGALYIIGGYPAPVIVNSAFWNNTAGAGGAIALNTLGTATLTNCTLASNSANLSGAKGALQVSAGTVVVTNTIIWGNTAGINIGSSGAATVSYSDVQGGVAGMGNINADPAFLNGNNGPGADGLWMTADDGLVIGACSPAKDAGNNSAVPGEATTDLKGAARIFNSTVDLGAYENTETLPTLTAYADSDSDGYGNATSTATYTCSVPQGYVTNSNDCDDNNAAINPATGWVLDADGDGYYTGDPVTQCTTPGTGYVVRKNQQPGDCNDDVASIYPGATEIPDDGIDQDCDGYDLKTWYHDSDGDTYGNNDDTLHRNTQPTNYVSNNTDCDDTNINIHPGAPEICGNGIDDNCDGQVDEGCVLTVNIQSASTTEGNSGKHPMYFTVQLNKPAPGKCDVQYVTKDLTAKVGNDYQQTKGTISFSKGQTSKTIAVYVYGDRIKEGNEQFQVILEKSKNVTIGTGTATGTIIDDDVITMAARTNPQSADTETDLVVPNVLHRSQLWRIPLLPTQNQVMVIDINGRIILKAPNYSNQHSFINVASGIYFYQIQTTKPDGKPKLYKGKLLIID